MKSTLSMQSLLVVEDDTDIRDSLVEALELEGYTVGQASNGRAAIELLLKTAINDLPNLIILDLMMPIMNGTEFLSHKSQDPRIAAIPVIVCSAVADRQSLADVHDFVKKPIDLGLLLTTVEKYLNRKC